VAIWEPQAGYLRPEDCIQAHVDGARIAGAEMHGDEAVLEWRPEGKGVIVRTKKEEYGAKALILANGAWLPSLLPTRAASFTVTRQPLFWFEPEKNAHLFDPGRFPIFIREHEPRRYIYGFPMLDGRVKFAIHMEGEVSNPETLRREASDEEVEKIRAILDRCLPGAAGNCVERAVCMYTNTADEHFRLGPLPELPQIFVASCCSGHGFKFASAVGEALADMVLGEEPHVDLRLFALTS
jgi:sarcosine oxidase